MAQQQTRLYDIDQADEFSEVRDKLSDSATHNFSVSLNAATARCSINLSSDDILDFAAANTQDSPSACRWLNLWALDDNARKAFHKLLQRYGVSPRLAHLLCLSSTARRGRPLAEASSDGTSGDSFDKVDRLEKASHVSLQANPSFTKPEPRTSQERGAPEVLDITRDLWHFCSIDWGRHYVCIGYNALFNKSVTGSSTSGKPDVIRVWSSLLLCSDGTVISTFETPPDARPADIITIRKNQLNILINLSRCHDSSTIQNPMFQVDIRPSAGTGPHYTDPITEPRFSQILTDAFDPLATASSLFYYLFDDWRATFDLVSGRQHPYRNRLDKLRQKMTVLAEVEDIEALHELGRQLTVLQRVYRSYEKIVDRLLQRQRQLLTSSPRSLHQQQHTSDTAPSIDTTETVHQDTANTQKTVLLPLPTVTRFERLLDRIRLFALTELDDCLAEKESLVLMNFNLLSLKNALSVETLTRTTMLLAKVTILFLPVSLMTAYFSLQMEEIDQLYSLKTYWGCFGVVGVLTVGMMVVFGMVSWRVKGRIKYEGMWRMGLTRLAGKRKRGKEI